jgi:putative glutamine amidotransferase
MGPGLNESEAEPPDPPLIALSTSEVRTQRTLRPIEHGEPTPHEFALAISYVRAIEIAGGVPVIVPPMGAVRLEPLLDAIDGLCLPGGPDLDPATYGEPPHPKLGPTDPEIDRFELHLARCAYERDLPILAICRGAQLLSVARGGSLIQHLPDLGAGVPHRQSEPGTETSHPVRVAAGSLLRQIVQAESIEVNSFHHQGIERLGEGLRAVAFAPDDTIEGLEAPDRRFCVGVQWHGETLVDREEEFTLFASFVEACAERSREGDYRLAMREAGISR